MAVGKSVFEIAAVEREKVDDAAASLAENVAEIQLGSHTYVLMRRPTAAQFSTMQIRLMRGDHDQTFRGIDRFMGALLLTPEEVLVDERKDTDGVLYTQRQKDGDRFIGMDYLWELYEEEKIDEDDLIGILKAGIEVHTGFPTESDSGSSDGPSPSGTTSTAASRRNSSRRSTSQ